VPRLSYAERRAVIAQSVRSVNLDGIRSRPYRWDWAESRKRAGWDAWLVESAIGAGALSMVREKARHEEPTTDKVLLRAIRALSIIDVGRAVEIVLPRWPERDEATACG
jgi:hypothetical protein